MRLELSQALQRLDAVGAELKAAAKLAAAEAARGVAADMARQYPIGPGSRAYGPGGNLRRGIKVWDGKRGSYVCATAPHSHLYEWGTKVRETTRGADRGQMPRRPVFTQSAMGHRRTYIDQLTRLVTGDIEI